MLRGRHSLFSYTQVLYSYFGVMCRREVCVVRFQRWDSQDVEGGVLHLRRNKQFWVWYEQTNQRSHLWHPLPYVHSCRLHTFGSIYLSPRPMADYLCPLLAERLPAGCRRAVLFFNRRLSIGQTRKLQKLFSLCFATEASCSLPFASVRDLERHRLCNKLGSEHIAVGSFCFGKLR